MPFLVGERLEILMEFTFGRADSSARLTVNITGSVTGISIFAAGTDLNAYRDYRAVQRSAPRVYCSPARAFW